MSAWRSGDVDDVHFPIADQRIGIFIPLPHAMPARVILRQFSIPAHDGDQLTSARLLKSRTAFNFRNIPAANDPPTNDLARAIHAMTVLRPCGAGQCSDLLTDIWIRREQKLC